MKPASPTRLRDLTRLIEELFTSDELRRFVAHSHLRELQLELPSQVGLATEAHHFVEILNRRNLVDEALFKALLRERPAQAVKIKIVANEWEIRIDVEYQGESQSSGSARPDSGDSFRAHHTISRNLSFIFGSVFITLLLIIAIFVPRWTPEQALVFRVVLSLAAAGIGAVLPGLLDVRARWANSMGLRAGGAVSLFVLVFLVTPRNPSEKYKSENAENTAPDSGVDMSVESAKKSKPVNDPPPPVTSTSGTIAVVHNSNAVRLCNGQKYELAIRNAGPNTTLVLLEYYKKTWRLVKTNPYSAQERIKGEMTATGSEPEPEALGAIEFIKRSDAENFIKRVKASKAGPSETFTDVAKATLSHTTDHRSGCLEYEVDPTCRAGDYSKELSMELIEKIECIERIENRHADLSSP